MSKRTRRRRSTGEDDKRGRREVLGMKGVVMKVVGRGDGSG